MEPIALATVALVVLAALGGGGATTPAPVTRPPGAPSRGPAQGPPSGFTGVTFGRDLLSPSSSPRTPRPPTRDDSWGPVSRAEPYSVAWYRDWARALGVEAPIPYQWIAGFGEDEPVRYGGDYSPAFSLVETAQGRRAWLRNVRSPDGVDHTGAPKRFALEFLARGAVVGPSPESGGTRRLWGPWHGLTVAGAKRAEELNYWPVDYKPDRDADRVNRGEVNPRREAAGDTIDAVGKAIASIPVVGPILSTVLSIVGKAISDDLSSRDVDAFTSEVNGLFTGLAGDVPEPIRDGVSTGIDTVGDAGGTLADGGELDAGDVLGGGSGGGMFGFGPPEV